MNADTGIDSNSEKQGRGAPSGGRKAIWIALAAALAVAVGIAVFVWVKSSPTDPDGGPVTLTPEEKLENYETNIENRWAEIRQTYPDAVRPTESLVRFVTRDEYGSEIVNCLADRNQDATVLGGGSDYRVDVAEGQEQAAAVAEFACIVQYPLDPAEPRLSSYGSQHLYEYLVEELVPCLQDEGYEIGEPPTLDEFRIGLDGETPWSPYRDVEESDAAKFGELRLTCPPLPDDLAL